MRKSTLVSWACVLAGAPLLLSGVGCASRTRVVPADRDAGPSEMDSGADGDFDSGQRPDVVVPGVDAACDRIFVEAHPETPNVMVVLDRSGSMYDFGLGGEMVDRWTPSVMAIEATTTALENRIAFGLMLFGNDSECGTGAVRVAPALLNATAIRTTLTGAPTALTGGGTPTALSLDAARAALALLPGQSYVLLVTDGAPNCNATLPSASCRCTAVGGLGCFLDSLNCLDDGRTIAAVSALLAAGIPTYVIGYDTGMWAGVMDAMASAGGTGFDHHFAVSDRASLDAALAAISGSVVSCSFELSAPPGDIHYVRVTVDAAPVDHESVRMDGSGWRLEGDRTITLIGPSCAAIQDGGDHAIEVVVECTPVIF